MKTTLLFFLSLGMASVAVALPPADLQQRLDEWIKGQPGGVAVAWVDGEGTAFFQAGRFDREDSPPITPDTQFEIGSITKVFTALLLAESERLGKVSQKLRWSAQGFFEVFQAGLGLGECRLARAAR